jgi:predicted ATPase/DNA-binding SARP family transcriptional activator
MRVIELKVLGAPLVTRNNTPLVFSRRKVLALFVYLGVIGKPKSRDFLTQLLFNYQDRKHSTSNFRQILSVLKKGIGDEFLITNGNLVSLPPNEMLKVDIHEFNNILEQVRERGVGNDIDLDIRMLGRAEMLYRDEFLSGFYLKKSVEFESWQLSEQDRCTKNYIYVLKTLMSLHEQIRNVEAALEYGNKWINADPLDERAYRSMMMLYKNTNQQKKAISVYECCREKIKQEFDLAPEMETQDLAQKIMEETGGAAGASNAWIDKKKPALLRNLVLPGMRSGFIGRKKILKEIKHAILEDDNAIITLTGPPGTGKTRTAIESAEKVKTEFPDGVFFIDLSPLTETDQILPHIARNMNIRESLDKSAALIDSIFLYLERKKMLIIFDNFEHLLAFAPVTVQMNTRCPSLKILNTSREALRVPDEKIINIPPMEVVNYYRSRDSSIHCEALRLFYNRAKSVTPELKPSRENFLHMLDICRRLDGIPLAIELAVARLKYFSLTELRDKIDGRLDILKNDMRTGIPRQKTLFDEIQWSFKLLDEREKSLFLWLSVFNRSFTLDAAEEVCGENKVLTKEQIIHGIESLLNKNLLKRNEEDGITRFYMLETIWEFSRVKLRSVGSEWDVKKSHAFYYHKLMIQWGKDIHGPDQMRILENIRVEQSNITDALQFLLSKKFHVEFKIMIHSLYWYWYRKGQISEGISWLNKGITLGVRDTTMLIDPYVYQALAFMHLVRGEWERSRTLYTESLNLFNKIDDKIGKSLVLAYLGIIERWLGDYEAGKIHSIQGVELAREAGDPVNLGLVLIAVNSTSAGKRLFNNQKEELFKAIRLAKDGGYHWVKAHALCGLGDLYLEENDYESAETYYFEALEEFLLIKDDWLIAWTYDGIAKVYYCTGRFDQARQYAIEALRIFHTLGDHRYGTSLLYLLGIIEHQQQNFALSASILGAYHVIAETLEEEIPNIDCCSSNIFAECKNNTIDWNRGAAMSYKEAVNFVIQTYQDDIIPQEKSMKV